MKSLNQFKAENGVVTIDLLQGKGRAYAKVQDKDLIVGSATDMKKPLFVIHNAEKGFYCLVNSDVKLVASI